MAIFDHATEAQITRVMLRRHWKKFDEFTECDVVVVGAGPAGLVASYELAKNGVKTMLVERNNYLGGGMFLGGYGMPEMVVRKPGNFIFDELRISYEVDEESNLCVANAPMAAGKIIAAAAEAGVFIVNLTSCEDLVVNDQDQVAGVVVNWMPVESLPRQITCVDPVGIQSKVVIATTGHDDAALVRRLSHLGLIPETKGMGTMNIRRSEDSVVEHTKEIYPGLIVAGMEAAAAFSLHRMGPTFGAMFLSGKRAAEVAMVKLGVMSEDGKLASIMG